MLNILFTIFLVVYTPGLFSSPLTVSIQAESAILMNADTGAILYEKEPHASHDPASITKVATAAYALRVAKERLNELFVADQEAIASVTEEARKKANYSLPAYWLVPGGSHIGIKKGEELSLRDLLFGLLVSSGNDAANVIAQNVGETIPQFMEQLNEYLSELGCQATTFCNPHGLYHPDHKTTAYDMALIMKEALKDDTFREVIASTSFKRPKTNKQESATLAQTNRLIRKGKHYYAKAIGGKTGYLSVAGNTLVAAAKHEDRILIAVLLQSKDREVMFRDAVTMFEAAFQETKVQRTVIDSGPQSFALDLEGAEKPIGTYTRETVLLTYYPAEEPNIRCFLTWKAVPLPIMKDQEVGELSLQTEAGEPIQTVSLFASEEVKETWGHWVRSFF